MRRKLAVGVVLLFAVVSVQAQSRGAIDWIFLVDTSKSMLKNGVFTEVQSSLDTFVREASEGDSVALLTFDDDVQLRTSTSVGADRSDLHAIIEGLAPEGNRTHLGAAIEAGLARPPSVAPRTSAIVLFTDGKEDIRGIRNPVPIPTDIADDLRRNNSHIFFVSMGEHEDRLRNLGRFIEANDAATIREMASRIRREIAPEPPPPPPRVTVVTKSLDFGELAPGTTTPPRDVTITSDKPTTVTITLAPVAGIAMPPREVRIANSATVPLQLAIAEDIAPGAQQLTLRIGTDAIPATLTVLAPSPLIRAAKWLLGIAILAIAALLARAELKRRNRLEGELEIVAPRTPADAAYVGLPTLKSDEIALSSIVPLDALAGSDARLYCRRKDGKKQVWIAASSGSLRINDVETPMSELYDADTIDIGAARLRFNRVGCERPQEGL
jgi:hypothetical protein